MTDSVKRRQSNFARCGESVLVDRFRDVLIADLSDFHGSFIFLWGIMVGVASVFALDVMCSCAEPGCYKLSDCRHRLGMS